MKFWGFIIGILLTVNASAFEKIVHFDSHIQIEENGDFIVTEQIRIICEMKQIRHGIFRDIPTEHRFYWNKFRQNPIEVLSIKRNGQPEFYRIEQGTRYHRIIIGSKDQVVPIDTHLYEIKYRTENHLINRKGYTEMFYNVIGDMWKFRIDSISCRVDFPKTWRTSEYKVYCGQFGEQSCPSKNQLSQGEFSSSLNKDIYPGESYTLGFKWAGEMMATPTLSESIEKHRFSLYLLYLLIAVSAASFLVWLIVGKDHTTKNPPIIPKPPKGISPFLASVLHYTQYTTNALKSSMVNIAVKGGMVMHLHSDETLKLVLTKKDTTQLELSQLERDLRDDLFLKVDEIQLSDRFNPYLHLAQRNFETKARKAVKKTRFFVKRVYLWIAVLLASSYGLIKVMDFAFMGTGNEYSGFIATVLLCLLAPSLIINYFFNPENLGYRSTMIVFAILVVLVSLFLSSMAISSFGLLPVVLALLIFGQQAWWYKILIAPTKKARHLIDELNGYRRFLKMSPEELQEHGIEPEDRKKAFNHLPYAIAMGVEKEFIARESAVNGELEDDQYFNWWRLENGIPQSGNVSDAFNVGLFHHLGTGIAISATSPYQGGSMGSSGGGSFGGGGFGGGFGGGGAGGGSGGGGGGGW